MNIISLSCRNKITLYYSIFTIYRVILASNIFRKFRYSQKVAWNTGAIICLYEIQMFDYWKFCHRNLIVEILNFFSLSQKLYLLKYFKSKVLFCLYFTQCSIYMKLVKISSTKMIPKLNQLYLRKFSCMMLNKCK